MLRSTRQYAVCYDVVGLAHSGLVTVGRETDASVRLDSAEIPFLLSRKHCTLQFQPDGRILLCDLGSTNGTYAARDGMPLRKLASNSRWELRDGDTIGFGGPEVIVVQREHVNNPFIFKFSAGHEEAAEDMEEEAIRPSGSGDLARDQEEDETMADDGEPSRAAAAGPGALALAKTLSMPVTRVKSDVCTAGSDTSNMGRRKMKRCSSDTESSSVADVLATHFACQVCLDWMVAAHSLSCGHLFCGCCLAKWLNMNQSCPSCRKAIAGVPVRAFQVDATISDLLEKGVSIMSPNTRKERSERQRHWEVIQDDVVPGWALHLHQRREAATRAAARHHAGFMAAQAVQAAAQQQS